MSSLASSAGLVYLGMDTSKDAIVVAVLAEGEQVPAVMQAVDRIFNDEASVRRLIGRFAEVGRLRCCYEAGPCGLARAWKAQRRLNGKYRQMLKCGKPTTVTATAVAREPAGFVWAEMTASP